MSLMIHQVGIRIILCPFIGKILIYGCSHWSTNQDIILVVLSQLDTFVDVQRLRIMIQKHSLLQGLPAERGREETRGETVNNILHKKFTNNTQ